MSHVIIYRVAKVISIRLILDIHHTMFSPHPTRYPHIKCEGIITRKCIEQWFLIPVLTKTHFFSRTHITTIINRNEICYPIYFLFDIKIIKRRSNEYSYENTNILKIDEIQYFERSK